LRELKVGGQLRIDLIKFETKDYFVHDPEIQGSNCIDLGSKLKRKKKNFKNMSLIAKHQL